MKREHALKLRNLIEKAAVSLSDSDALEGIELFEHWQPDTDYESGARRQRNGKLYRCEQAHTSQAIYPPETVPALWTEVAPEGVIPVWRQPTGAQDAYQKGDPVLYPDENGDVWVSTVNDNVWEPGVYGWEREQE